ncbi:hypothetical protein BV25DRAFT_1811559 [Artomyces pyxidatus]|uniref:Uncharacterized protein n=1 Tax=Artomyces pyxidatus TaxID=48021 RepID=A0ACB8SNP8_9AGAM|nr:hypothetical protein BV25DRAFT_1811559 [Artomyces pyxidatus]
MPPPPSLRVQPPSAALRTPVKSPQFPQTSAVPRANIGSAAKSHPAPIEDDEDGLFLSSASSSTPAPAKMPPRGQPSRPRTSMPPPLPALLAHTPSAPGATGTKRKPTALPVTLPYKRTLTPLSVTKSQGAGSFDRLAPLPAPAFRTPQSKTETEVFLRGGPATMAKLSLGGGLRAREVLLGEAKEGEEEEAVGVSPGGHVTKRRAKSRPVSWELMESAGVTVQVCLDCLDTPVEVPSTVAFPTARSRTSSSSSPLASPAPRQRTTHASNVSTSSRRSRTRTQSISQTRPLTRRVESSGSATLFFGPAIPRTNTPARARHSVMFDSPPSSTLRPQPLFGRPQLATRHSYAGPMTDADDFVPMDIRAMDDEDLFFGSSSFSHSVQEEDEGIGVEESFAWAEPEASSFSISVTESTPSPRSKTLGYTVPKLEKKYKPRDSGVVLTDDEDVLPSLPSGRGFGRSGSVLAADFAMPSSSTSVSTLASDPELVTPGLGPSAGSGWPGLVASSSAASALSAFQVGSDVDAFIVNTLLHAQSAEALQSKRPPGTPHKRLKTAFGGQRPWQSAVASKVGFDFGDEEAAKDGAAAGAKKKAPRKSLPAAFPMLGKGRRGKDDSDEEDASSPSDRKSGYEGIGLGRPSVGKGGRPSWLMRRSSSGAISVTSGSGSGEGSSPATPTAGKGSVGWQLPPPRIPGHLSPLKTTIPSHLSPHRTASSTSSSTSALNAGAPPVSPFKMPRLPPHAPSLLRARPSLGFLGGTAGASEHERPGKFEREFVEIGEVGSGEFGKVMKVRRKDREEISAVKKSKRFEGARHRLRLHEEVEILQHLQRAYATSSSNTRHPNILAYIDSWEQDEALYIQTELCDLGNFAHFLWEYGRAFPKLEEARVWKILADLSNGLRFMHDAGVIHLDLKPANIFVTGEGRFKIGDFGMASLWPRGTLSATGFEREGDKLYLAPEVLQGRYGKAADMFSLGITMLETASNIVVPDQGEPWHRLRRDDFSQVDLPEDTSAELVALIRNMMRADPALRVDATGVWSHPVVARTRSAMERMLADADASPFAASPLAGVPDGFIEEILGQGDAMDVGA